MRVYPDTSFISALYQTDSLTAPANRYMALHQHPLVLMELQRAEVRNTFRLRVAQDLLPSTEMIRALLQFDRDLDEGIYECLTPDWAEFFRIFETISRKYTEKGANRFADILHVAGALSVEARIFLTFDKRQARLASIVGLKTPLQLDT